MKFSFSFLALAASAALVSAQNLGNLPSCALPCFATAVPASGCSLTDTTCQCTTGRDKITASIAQCVPGKCSADEISQIAPAVQALCKSAGITLTNVPTVAPTGATQSRTATATAARTSATTGAAVANVAGVGAVALGLAAVFGL